MLFVLSAMGSRRAPATLRLTATSGDGTPTARCIASAPASRKPKKSAAGRTPSGLRAPISAIDTALIAKPAENPR